MMEIKSTDNKLIKQFASLKNKKYRDEYKLFLIDDLDLIIRADELGLLEYYLFDNKQVDLKNCPNIIKTTSQILTKLSNLETIPNGIGVCKIIETGSNLSNFIVALDDVQDPGNGGTILRSALAFNYNTMLLSLGSFDKYNEKFIRASKGAFFDSLVIRTNLEDKLKELKNEGYMVVVADLDEKAVKLNDFKPFEKMILVVGNEGNGISSSIKKLADLIVYIPIKSIESLNVGVAASIIMSKNIY